MIGVVAQGWRCAGVDDQWLFASGRHGFASYASMTEYMALISGRIYPRLAWIECLAAS